MKPLRVPVLCALAWMLAPGVSPIALAQPPEAPEVAPAASADGDQKPWRFSVVWENDGAFIRPGGPDRHYTSGLTFTLAHQPDWADGMAEALGLRYDATAVSYHFGQMLFTPQNITLPVPGPDDRPYAGYLFGGVSWQREQNRQLDHLQLDLGIVGPSAGGKDIQRWVHSTFAGDNPQGWDTQIEDTFAYQFTYRKKWLIDLNDHARPERGDGLAALDWQLIPQAGFGLGNVYRQAEAGATLRFGQHLPDDFGPARINDPASATHLSREMQASRDGAMPRWNWYVFGRAMVRFVEHNIFIDGPDNGRDTTVSSEPVVGEFAAGIAARYRIDDTWMLDIQYTQTLLTDEFKEQDKLDGYATLMVGVRATW